MMQNYWLTEEEKEQIKKLYLDNHSCQEIKDILKLPHTVRTLQRTVVRLGINRTVGDAFRLAVKKGRVHFALKELQDKAQRAYLSPKMRLHILSRDGFKCSYCGATKKTTVLEVDHINGDATDNREENLQTLCHECNFAKG